MAGQNIKSKIKSVIRRVKRKELIPIPTPISQEQILEGKVALITGGSGGIGYAMAKAFIHCGCRVIIAGTNMEKLQKLCDDLNSPNIKYIVLNVLNIDEMEKTIEEAASLFEDNKIDILVNSAGIVAQSKFLEMSEKEYDLIMDINAKGTYFMSQAMGKYMISKKIKGHILNVTSSSALRPAWTPYQMSKWAIRGFTLGLADALLPYGIVVNAIAPGPVATPMLGRDDGDSIYLENCPAKRMATPDEIASLATFMVSDLGNLIIGDTFYMTGGSGTISYHN